MEIFNYILMGINALCAGINFARGSYWILALNILAVMLCAYNIYKENR